MTLKPEHAKLAGYFNLDNGTGKIRGVFLQGNEAVRPIFEAWLKPFAALGATALAIQRVGGDHHLDFDHVGLPAFQFVQDPIDYDTRTHHTNMDVLESIQEADLQQAAAVVATFVYHAAMRDEKLPHGPSEACPTSAAVIRRSLALLRGQSIESSLNAFSKTDRGADLGAGPTQFFGAAGTTASSTPEPIESLSPGDWWNRRRPR